MLSNSLMTAVLVLPAAADGSADNIICKALICVQRYNENEDVVKAVTALHCDGPRP